MKVSPTDLIINLSEAAMPFYPIDAVSSESSTSLSIDAIDFTILWSKTEFFNFFFIYLFFSFFLIWWYDYYSETATKLCHPLSATATQISNELSWSEMPYITKTTFKQMK